MDLQDFWAWFFSIIAALIISGLVTLAGVAIYNSAKADGRIEYCFIEIDSQPALPIYHLHGYRSWRPDRFIASFGSVEAATAAAATLQCPLRSK